MCQDHVNVVIQGANIRHGSVRICVVGVTGIDQRRSSLEVIIISLRINKKRILADIAVNIRRGAVGVHVDHVANRRRQASTAVGCRCIPGIVIVNVEIHGAVFIIDRRSKTHQVIVLD